MKQIYRSKHIKNKNKIIIIIIIILFFDIIIFNSISDKFSKNIISIIKVKIEEINKYYLNDIIKRYLNIDTNDYIKVNIVNNNIISVDIDSYKSNILLKNVINDIENNIKKIEDGRINNYHNLKYVFGKNGLIFLVPIGTLNNNVLVGGLGPKIPIKASFLENVESYVDVNVKNYGVNNSIIKLYIIINIKEIIEMPTNSATLTIKYKYLLSSKLIAGKVPSYLGGTVNDISNKSK